MRTARWIAAAALVLWFAPAALAAEAVDLQNATCPVKGTPAKVTVMETYKGMKVHFCCTNCAAKFRADPEKYVSNLRKEPAVAKRMDEVLAAEGSPPLPATEPKLDGWAEPAKEAVQKTTAKYGAPKSSEADMVVWENVKPWKRVVAHREGAALEQVVAYKAANADALKAFSEHVAYDAEKVEMSARHDREELNVLALNLGDDVATGKKTADQAKAAWTEAEKAIKEGKAPANATKLQFEPAKPETK
jgi:YHS domain-containing protein